MEFRVPLIMLLVAALFLIFGSIIHLVGLWAS